MDHGVTQEVYESLLGHVAAPNEPFAGRVQGAATELL